MCGYPCLRKGAFGPISWQKKQLLELAFGSASAHRGACLTGAKGKVNVRREEVLQACQSRPAR